MYVREVAVEILIIMKSHITCYINNSDFHRTADGNSNSCLFEEKKTDVKNNVAAPHRTDKRTYPRFDHANI